MEPVLTIGVICFRGDQVLLLKPGPQSKHQEEVYGVPSGRLEKEESLAEGALRELAEETGIQLTPEDIEELPETYEAHLKRRDGSSVFMRWHAFVAIEDVQQEPISTPEGIPVWVNVEKITELILQQNIEAVVEQALRYRSS